MIDCGGKYEKINTTVIVKGNALPTIVVKKVSENYDILSIDDVIGVDTSNSEITLRLPIASELGNKLFWIKDVGPNAFNNNIIINSQSGDTIIDILSGQTSTIIGVDGGAITLSSNGIDEYWVM